MGRQICFFATQKDVDFLVREVEKKEGFILDFSGNALSQSELASIADEEYCQQRWGSNQFCVATKNSSITYKNSKIDVLSSDIITFSLCKSSPKQIIDTSCVDQQYQRRDCVIITAPQEYRNQIKELIKCPVYITNPNYVKNGYQHARFWCSTSKDLFGTKEFEQLFLHLKKVIQKTFRLSKDKQFYLGEDADKQFQKGLFIPCCGKNHIDFK